MPIRAQKRHGQAQSPNTVTIKGAVRLPMGQRPSIQPRLCGALALSLSDIGLPQRPRGRQGSAGLQSACGAKARRVRLANGMQVKNLRYGRRRRKAIFMDVDNAEPRRISLLASFELVVNSL